MKQINEKLFDAVVELVEASFVRDFTADGHDEEERVFDALHVVLDEILAAPECAKHHAWVHALWAEQEREDLQPRKREKQGIEEDKPQ